MKNLAIICIIFFFLLIGAVILFSEPPTIAQTATPPKSTMVDVSEAEKALEKKLSEVEKKLESIPDPVKKKSTQIIKYRTVQKTIYVKPSPEVVYFFYKDLTLEKKINRDGGLLVMDLDSIIKWVSSIAEDDTATVVEIKPVKTKNNFFHRLFKTKKQ